MNEGQALWIALNASVVAIICGIIFSLGILKQPDGNEKNERDCRCNSRRCKSISE